MKSAMIRAMVDTSNAFPRSLLQLLMRIALVPVFLSLRAPRSTDTR